MLGGGTVFHDLNLNGQSAASFCPERYFLRSVAAQKILSSTKMVKKKEVSIDEKLKMHIWTEAGIKIAEIAARLGRGESTIRRLRAELS
jgi:hypothetical protein